MMKTPIDSNRRRATKIVAAIAMVIWLFSSPLIAIAQSSGDGSAGPQWSGSWKPHKSNAGGWDWVRLQSGEWIKGEIVLMRDFDLDFDSDEFGVVEIDWDDVAEILTERAYTLVLQDMTTSYTGTMVMRGEDISVYIGNRIETFDREQLLAITASDRRELNLWTMRASFGVGLRSGNTEQADLTGRLRLGREGKTTRFGIEYNGEYGSLDNKKNTNNHRGRSNFDYFLTRDFFLTPASFEAYTDEFQNIAYRLTPTVGFGYYLFRRSRLEWQVRFGAGYQHTRLDSAVSGDSKTSENSAITFGSTIDVELNSRIDLLIEYQLQFIAPETDLTNHHSEATLEIELTSAIDLEVGFIWDRIEGPETDSDGSTPDSNDFRMSVGLAIEY